METSKIRELSDKEFTKLKFKETGDGKKIIINKNGKSFFDMYITYFNCCGMCELDHPEFHANQTILMKRLVKYLVKNRCSSLVICNFQKNNQKDAIDFFRSIGFKDITTYTNKNTANELVSLYYKNN